MGNIFENETLLVTFLKSLDKTELYDNLIHEAKEVLGIKQEDVYFKPIIENIQWRDAFITETPERILKNQRHEIIDTMMGYTSAVRDLYMFFLKNLSLIEFV